MKLQLAVLALLVCCAMAVIDKPYYKAHPDKRIPGRYIVGLKDGNLMTVRDTAVKTIMSLQKTSNIDVQVRKILTNLLSVEMTDNAILLVLAIDEVAYIEEDSLYHASAVASWGIDRIDQRNLPVDDTFTPRGDGTDVNIYIIDTGIKYSHEEFNGRALYFYDALNGNGVDCNGHGSHCAGIAASATYGVAKNAYVWGIRVLSCLGLGTNVDIIEGMNRVRYYGFLPGVIAITLSGSASYSLDNEVRLLKTAGYTVVAPAGNDADNACYYSPARSANAITVGATTTSDVMSAYSNYGECVQIFAPGDSIRSTWYDSNSAISVVSGTSMAAAHVAGTAAVILGENLSLTPDQVESKLTSESSKDKLLFIEDSPNRLVYVGV
ncbi:aqualysin-1-like [Glandiceps talaboti]